MCKSYLKRLHGVIDDYGLGQDYANVKGIRSLHGLSEGISQGETIKIYMRMLLRFFTGFVSGRFLISVQGRYF